MDDQAIASRARTIVEQAEHGVLITVDEQGFPHARTMWTAGLDDDFTVYFVTGRALQKCGQIAANPKVCAFWTQVEDGKIGWSYAVLKGEAQVTDQESLRHRFWHDELTQYFPGGKDDPNYVVIVMKPKELLVMDSHKYPLDRVVF